MGCILGCIVINYENIEDKKKQIKPSKSYGECPICFEDMNDDLLALPCSHLYHTKCANKWFQTKRTCPLCTTSIDVNNGNVCRRKCFQSV